MRKGRRELLRDVLGKARGEVRPGGGALARSVEGGGALQALLTFLLFSEEKQGHQPKGRRGWGQARGEGQNHLGVQGH